MAKFNMVVPHELPHGEALRRIRSEIENLKREYGDKITSFRESWSNNTYAFEGVGRGFTVPGAVTVGSSQIEIQAELPWLAIPFKGRIEAVIRERLISLLG
jgi:Putative polyhydroxyalkanoic acid system protein (PHA_gran_rgn)